MDLPDYEFTPGRTPFNGVQPFLMPFPPRVPSPVGQTPSPQSPPPNLSPHTPPPRQPVWRRRPRISPATPEWDSDGNPIEYYTGPESDYEDPEDGLQDEEPEEEPDDPNDPCREVRRQRDQMLATADRLRRTIVNNHIFDENHLRQVNERHDQIEATLTRRLNEAHQEIVSLGGVVPRSPGLQALLRDDSLEDDEGESDDPLYSMRSEPDAAIAEGDIIIAQRNHYAQDNVLLRAEVDRLQGLNQAQEQTIARLRLERDDARSEVYRLEAGPHETSDDPSKRESRPHSSEEDDADEDPCREFIDERDGLLTERAELAVDRLHMLHTIDLGREARDLMARRLGLAGRRLDVAQIGARDLRANAEIANARIRDLQPAARDLQILQIAWQTMQDENRNLRNERNEEARLRRRAEARVSVPPEIPQDDSSSSSSSSGDSSERVNTPPGSSQDDEEDDDNASKEGSQTSGDSEDDSSEEDDDDDDDSQLGDTPRTPSPPPATRGTRTVIAVQPSLPSADLLALFPPPAPATQAATGHFTRRQATVGGATAPGDPLVSPNTGRRKKREAAARAAAAVAAEAKPAGVSKEACGEAYKEGKRWQEMSVLDLT